LKKECAGYLIGTRETTEVPVAEPEARDLEMVEDPSNEEPPHKPAVTQQKGQNEAKIGCGKTIERGP